MKRSDTCKWLNVNGSTNAFSDVNVKMLRAANMCEQKLTYYVL